MEIQFTRAIGGYVGRFDSGDDVIEALVGICEAHSLSSAALRVTGTITDVELVRFDADSRQYVTTVDHRGPFEIVRLDGQMASIDGQPVIRVSGLIAADAPGGPQLSFGQVRRACAQDCEFVVEVYEGVEIVRRPDANTGRFPIASVTLDESSVATAPTAQAAPAPAPPATASAPTAPLRERVEPQTVAQPAAMTQGSDKSGMSWEDAMEASDEIQPARKRPEPSKAAAAPSDPYEGYDFEEILVKAGDILDHPRLGECRVIRVEDDEYAHIRLKRGQIRKLALELIELTHTGTRDGKNVFKVRVRK